MTNLYSTYLHPYATGGLQAAAHGGRRVPAGLGGLGRGRGPQGCHSPGAHQQRRGGRRRSRQGNEMIGSAFFMWKVYPSRYPSRSRSLVPLSYSGQPASFTYKGTGRDRPAGVQNPTSTGKHQHYGTTSPNHWVLGCMDTSTVPYWRTVPVLPAVYVRLHSFYTQHERTQARHALYIYRLRVTRFLTVGLAHLHAGWSHAVALRELPWLGGGDAGAAGQGGGGGRQGQGGWSI